MARLGRPRASVCKFPAQNNYALTKVPATGIEPGTARLRIRRVINCATTRHRAKRRFALLLWSPSADVVVIVVVVVRTK